MDTLCINPVSCFDNGDGVFPECDSTALQNISLDEAIQEVDCKCFSYGNAIIGVRSDYSCSFLTKSFEVCAILHFCCPIKVFMTAEI